MRAAAAGWFDSLRVRGKLGAVLAVQLIVLTVGSVSVLAAVDQMRRARAWSDHTHVVIEQVQALLVSAVEQQTGLRGYVITAQPRFLDPYRAGVVEFEAVAARLRTLLVDNRVQGQRLERVVTLMGEWQEQIAARDLVAMERPETRHVAIENTASGAGKRRIDAIKHLCDEMVGEERGLLAERTETVAQLETLVLGLVAALLVLGWLAGAQAVALINRAVGGPLSRLASLVPRLITGESVEVPFIERRDEVGVLATAFERLRDASAEQRRRDWIGEQSAALLGALQHCDTEASFGEMLLRRLAGALDAGYAMAYRWNERAAALDWCAAYGLPDPAVMRRSFKLGEGLVGQCMVERRMLRISPVPDGYLQVVSGLGAALPHTLWFVPMTARGETVAVLELGLLQAPSAEHLALIEQVVITSALAWQALSRSLHTRELLGDSQALAEELQSQQDALRIQQEELRAVNEALRGRTEQLEEQGRRLKVSEEELRSQAEELRITNAALEEKTSALQQRQSELEFARQELERKAADLEQASRYKSEFLANMSHELRTPLNSMLILSKMLSDNAEGNLDAEQVESARVMHESGRSLLGLINDILDLSKVEAGKMAVNLEDVPLSRFLESLAERFRPLANERRLRFVVDSASGLPAQIRTDGARLAQVLSNLLANAFKFTHDGEVELRAEPARLGAAPAVAFAVRDTGIGIAPEQLDRVFQAFEQADSSTSRRYGGTGLGLSIVRGMSALLGGEVRVQSRQGVGSTFTVLVPEQAGTATPAPSPPPGMRTIVTPAVASRAASWAPAPAIASDVSPLRAAAPVGTPALLIVEDDPGFARVLADIAVRRGQEVLVAGTGQEALALAQRHRLNGVLLDLGLPDMSGWDVLQRLRDAAPTAQVPVHVISGAEDDGRGQAQGVVGFLQKPVARDAVMQALDRLGAAAPRRRLLVLDHDEVERAHVVGLLASAGTEITEAASAAEGLKALSTTAFDGLILDPDLRDAPHLEFLSEAAALGPLPPVVIYSRRELSADESLRLREYTGSIVIRGARSSERLLDEVHLFLHVLERPGPAPAATTPHAPVADLVGKTVLVVDDDMRNVFALSKALRGKGLSVVMAQDGHKALAQLTARSEIDVVLMDVMMPGMDGYETIRRIRAQAQWSTLPIIAVTAKAMAGDREKCLEAGANDYCSKPIDVDRLISLLQVWV